MPSSIKKRRPLKTTFRGDIVGTEETLRSFAPQGDVVVVMSNEVRDLHLLRSKYNPKQSYM
jgi:hypothetical protein